MDAEQIFNKFEKDQYLKQVVENSLFYTMNPYKDDLFLYFINDSIPMYGTKSDVELTKQSDESKLINVEKLLQYLKEKHISSSEFDKYLEIKEIQSEYKFINNMRNCVNGLISSKLVDNFNEDMDYLYATNYDAYSCVLWALLELLYFYQPITKVLESFKLFNMENTNILYAMMYVSKYTNTFER